MNGKLSLFIRYLAFFLVLANAAFPFSTSAQNSGWEHIRVSPESGHWNFPGYFVLEATQDVTVAWAIKCTEGGCDRPDEDYVSHTFRAGESILVGWGHQCYRWQLDPYGRTGFIAEAEPWLCVTPTPTQTAPPPTETPSPTPTETVPPQPTPTETAPLPLPPTDTPLPPSPPLPTETDPPPPPTDTPPPPPLPTETVPPPPPPPLPTETVPPPPPTETAPPTPPPTETAPSPLITPTPAPLPVVIPPVQPTAPPAAVPTGEALLPATGHMPPASLISPRLWPSDEQLAVISRPRAAGFGNIRAGSSARQAFIEAAPAKDYASASPITGLKIPSLNVDSTVRFVPFEYQSWDIKDLVMDVAWLGGTSSPEWGSNTVLAAHITMENLGNGPFRNIKNLKAGDLVYVYTAENEYVYAVQAQLVVMPYDFRVVGSTDKPQITLLTCTGWDESSGQYLYRRAVTAELVRVLPLAAEH
jgi:LPXTG-site transpeptidase (sortase) family protein